METTEMEVLFNEAKRLVRILGWCSNQFLMEHFGIGYNKGGRLMDLLEEKQIISEFQGDRKRRSLISNKSIAPSDIDKQILLNIPTEEDLEKIVNFIIKNNNDGMDSLPTVATEAYNSGLKTGFMGGGEYVNIVANRIINDLKKTIALNNSEINKVTRVEVVDHTQDFLGDRKVVYSKRSVPAVELSYQDEGRTLKIFLSEKQK